MASETKKLVVLVAVAALATFAACSPLPPLSPADAPPGKANADAEDEAEPAPAAEPDVDSIVTRAEQALASGDQALAEKLAREAIALDAAGYPQAYVVLGEVATARGEHTAALASFQKAMALDGTDPWAVVHASESLAALDRKKEGRDLLRAFVAKQPDAVPEVYDALGSTELELDDPTRAEAAFRVAVERSGGKDGDAFYGLALVAQERHQVGPLVRALRSLLELDPSRREALNRDPELAAARKFPAVRSLLATPHGATVAPSAPAKKPRRSKRR